jgi:putative N-acetylmannosamine-6-phosphate epimerase
MRPSRGMGDINPSKMPGKKTIKRKDNPEDVEMYAEGGKTKSKVNAAGNYTKPELRKRIFNSVKAAAIVGTGAGEWSARKAQVMAKRYKAAGGGYRD